MTDLRDSLLTNLAVTERRLTLAGLPTAVLQAGEGSPVVLLHEPGSFAAHWAPMIEPLARAHRVIAPDLPGHGASGLDGEKLDGPRVLAWLGELIDRTAAEPPVLVGHLGAGAIAARFAAGAGAGRLRSLVLIDSFGLGGFRPAPGFAFALFRYVARPTPRTYHGLMRRCTADFDDVRAALGDRWQLFEDYTLEGARSPAGKAALRVMMRELAVPAIPTTDLERIDVPTFLIWGRRDPVNRLRIAQAASRRYGWPLHVIDDAADDPPLERPQECLAALAPALA